MLYCKTVLTSATT